MPGILKWIIDNKETIGWIIAGIAATYRTGVFLYKKVIKPCIEFVKKVNYEINNNGGKSMKDGIDKTNSLLIKLIATQDAVLSVSDQCFFRCDEHGYCTFANESLCDLYGATLDDMLGLGWINFIKQEEREAAEKNWKRAIQSDRQVTFSYTVINGNTNEEIPCYYRAAIKRDNDNKVISILGIVFKK